MPAVRRDVFQGIADPTRRAILSMITEEPKNLNTIAENFDVSRPAISQHIKILKECGLVMIRKEGRQRYCEPKLETLAEVADWIEPFKKIWESRFNQLDNLLEELKANKSRKDN